MKRMMIVGSVLLASLIVASDQPDVQMTLLAQLMEKNGVPADTIDVLLQQPIFIVYNYDGLWEEAKLPAGFTYTIFGEGYDKAARAQLLDSVRVRRKILFDSKAKGK